MKKKTRSGSYTSQTKGVKSLKKLTNSTSIMKRRQEPGWPQYPQARVIGILENPMRVYRNLIGRN